MTQKYDRFSLMSFPCFTHEQVKEINKKIKENILQAQDSSMFAQNVSKMGDFSIASIFFSYHHNEKKNHAIVLVLRYLES